MLLTQFEPLQQPVKIASVEAQFTGSRRLVAAISAQCPRDQLPLEIINGFLQRLLGKGFIKHGFVGLVLRLLIGLEVIPSRFARSNVQQGCRDGYRAAIPPLFGNGLEGGAA